MDNTLMKRQIMEKISILYYNSAKCDIEFYNRGMITWVELGERLTSLHKQELKDLRRLKKKDGVAYFKFMLEDL